MATYPDQFYGIARIPAVDQSRKMKHGNIRPEQRAATEMVDAVTRKRYDEIIQTSSNNKPSCTGNNKLTPVMIYKSFSPGRSLSEFIRNYTIIHFQFPHTTQVPFTGRLK